ncbi:HAD family hydrolase [Hafnia paralvei]|uniref:HAD family hydrolase n=1 Tax=Hafnia paralvei TaxID=546367 RepID=UPI0020325FD7|nr:HAD-IA family hydrolase [Hafnia paralvei]
MGDCDLGFDESSCRTDPPNRFTPSPVLITSENIIHGKPHPQPFLLGAERLGIQPEQCAAFEDSLAGLQSVWAAGCQAVEVKTAHSVPHNLGQIPALEDYRSIRISPRYDHFFLSFQ